MLQFNLKPPYKNPGETHASEPETVSYQEAGIGRKECMTVVSENVCIQADVKIVPKVITGRITTFCGEAKIGKCGYAPCSKDACEFSVSRTLCVQIPLEFSAETFVRPAGIACGEPELEPCRICED